MPSASEVAAGIIDNESRDDSREPSDAFPPDGMEPRMDAIPALGEHTERVLRELGLSEPEVQALRRDGAI